MFDTPNIQADDAKLKEVLKNVVIYVLLAPHGTDQWDHVHRIHLIRQIELIPEYNKLLELFINEEIINWNSEIVKNYEQLLRQGTTTSPAPSGVSFCHLYNLRRLVVCVDRGWRKTLEDFQGARCRTQHSNGF